MSIFYHMTSPLPLNIGAVSKDTFLGAELGVHNPKLNAVRSHKSFAPLLEQTLDLKFKENKLMKHIFQRSQKDICAPVREQTLNPIFNESM
mmetsp:Transcript_27536/g.72763  ORF Transcript_27536/g.72763 Transcript_27536/m.72763 type:complete len:91 (+) Transcript_27536:411-683(+)